MGKAGTNGTWKVLLVDDEKNAREIYGSYLRDDGQPFLTAASGAQARRVLKDGERVGLVSLDLRLPDVDGLELFRWIREAYPALPVIILTAYGSIESAVLALKEGAYYYLTKPADSAQWKALVEMALQQKRLEDENYSLRQQLRRSPGEGELIGRSRPMLEVYQWIRIVAPSRSTVLIGGESGTGKELVARAIHEAGPCREGPFVGINCGALPPTLLESELFGYEKGAFTGAVTSRPGRFEAADGGTVFLDEVGECTPELQVRLLRVLQEKEFQRLGGTERIKSDFRLLAATNRSLEEEVKNGMFREDLFYRINVIRIDLPPLRDRREDIPLLSSYFLERYSRREGKSMEGITAEALDRLRRYQWPGNVRELENVIERGVVVARDRLLSVADLPPEMGDSPAPSIKSEIPLHEDCSLASIESSVIASALRRHGGNKSKAARVLGISRKMLYSKMREHSL